MDNYTEVLHLRVSPDLKKEVENMAKQHDRTLASMARVLVKTGIETIKSKSETHEDSKH